MLFRSPPFPLSHPPPHLSLVNTAAPPSSFPRHHSKSSPMAAIGTRQARRLRAEAARVEGSAGRDGCGRGRRLRASAGQAEGAPWSRESEARRLGNNERWTCRGGGEKGMPWGARLHLSHPFSSDAPNLCHKSLSLSRLGTRVDVSSCCRPRASVCRVWRRASPRQPALLHQSLPLRSAAATTGSSL